MRHLIYRAYLLAFVVIVAFTPSVWGQKSYVLALGSEGSSTLVIAEGEGKEDNVAYLTDGGRKSGGIGSATIDGESIFVFLKDNHVRHLIVTCSHPHDDHIGGLIALLKSDRMLELNLNKLDFVESGFKKDGTGGRLYDIYEDYWKAKPQRPLKANPHSADNKDAFAEIETKSTRVSASNFVYEAKGDAGLHGRSVITTYQLERNGKSVRLTDFDDADDELVRKWAEWAAAAPNQRKPDIEIMPHHGTGLERTDVSPLFAEAIKPKDVIFSVNARNRYVHPRWNTVRLCLAELGEYHVHFTAGTDNLLVTHEGLQTVDTAMPPLHRFLKVIAPKVEAVQDKIALYHEASDLTKAQRGWLKTYTDWVEGCAEVCRDWNVPKRIWPKFRDIPSDEGLLSRIPLVDPKEPKSGGGIGSSINPIWPSPAHTERASFYPNTGSVKEHFKASNNQFRIAQSKIEAKASPPLTRFNVMSRRGPIFGGIAIGNEFVCKDGKAISAKVEYLRNEESLAYPRIVVVFKPNIGEQRDVVFEGFTTTELWAAYRFLNPDEGVKSQFELEAGEPGLVGIEENLRLWGAPVWSFGIHPAIANTHLAVDGMRLDMCLSHDRAPGWLPPLPPRGWFENYQWYDEAAAIRIVGSDVVVSAVNGRQNSLMRFRLWGKPVPNWIESGADSTLAQLQSSVSAESRLRFKALVAKVEGLDKTPAFRLALDPLTNVTNRDSLEKELKKRELADTPVGQIRLLLFDANNALLTKSKKADFDNEREWALLLADELEEITKKMKGDIQLSDTPAFKLLVKRLRIEVEVRNQLKINPSDPAAKKQMLVEIRKQLATFAKAEKLSESPEYVSIDWQLFAEGEVLSELSIFLKTEPSNLKYPSETYVSALLIELDAVSRFDRFAKLVSVLRWVKQETQTLPKLGGALSPKRLNVPPAFFFRDVFVSPKDDDADQRERAIFQFDPAEISKIEFKGWKSESDELNVAVDSEGKWAVTRSPPQYSLDPNKIDGFLSMLSTTRAKQYLTGGLAPEYGFGDANVALRVILTKRVDRSNWFKLTDQSLVMLQKAIVPIRVRQKLNRILDGSTLKDKELSQEDFVGELTKRLSKTEMLIYKDIILINASETIEIFLGGPADGGLTYYAWISTLPKNTPLVTVDAGRFQLIKKSFSVFEK